MPAFQYFVVVPLLLLIAEARPFVLNGTQVTSHSTQPSATACTLQGNSDLYGLGIRLGYYTQASAVWIGTYLAKHDRRELRGVNTLFMAVMLIGLLVMTINPNGNYAVEAYLLLQLVFSALYIGPFAQALMAELDWNDGADHALLDELLGALVSAYSIWFWYRGLDVLPKSSCETFVFWLWKLDLYGGLRTFNQVLIVLMAPLGVYRGTTRFVRGIQRLRSRHIDLNTFAKSMEDYATRFYTTPCSCSSDYNSEVSPKTAIHAQPYSNMECRQRTQLYSSRLDGDVGGRPLRAWRCDLDREPDVSISMRKSHKPGSPVPKEDVSRLFEDVYEADRFLSECLEQVCSKKATMTVRTYNLLGLPVIVFSPSVQFRNNWNTLKLLFSRWRNGTLNLSILLETVSYFRRGIFYSWEDKLNLVATAADHPKYTTMSWQSIHVAATIRTTNRSESKMLNRRTRTIHGIFSFTVLALHILAVELTIRWNNIRGLQGLGSVGQLIPFGLGGGVLLKTLYSEAMPLLFRRDDATEHSHRGVSRLEDLADKYYKCKLLCEGLITQLVDQLPCEDCMVCPCRESVFHSALARVNST